MTEPTQRERIAILETQVAHLVTTVDSMNDKLTDLVSLKNKGTGAAWLLGIIWASGVIGGLSALWQWFRG
jgi:hypothetical protein